jgi:hypothetical protein
MVLLLLLLHQLDATKCRSSSATELAMMYVEPAASRAGEVGSVQVVIPSTLLPLLLPTLSLFLACLLPLPPGLGPELVKSKITSPKGLVLKLNSTFGPSSDRSDLPQRQPCRCPAASKLRIMVLEGQLYNFCHKNAKCTS